MMTTVARLLCCPAQRAGQVLSLQKIVTDKVTTDWIGVADIQAGAMLTLRTVC